MAGKDNLKRIRTTEEAREKGRKGGKRSVEVRREKKLLSMVYADMLSEKYGKGEKGVDLKSVIKGILADGGSPAVSMLREIREATEGSKITGEIEFSDPMKIIERHMQKIHADKDESR